jgi:preprotein translocase subunit YajC
LNGLLELVGALMLAQQAPGGAGRGSIVIMIYTVAFIAIMWFIMIAPQRRMQKKHQAMVAALKRGDEIMTEGGIIGTIVHAAEDRLTIKTGENTRLVVARSKIVRLMTQSEEKS